MEASVLAESIVNHEALSMPDLINTLLMYLVLSQDRCWGNVVFYASCDIPQFLSETGQPKNANTCRQGSARPRPVAAGAASSS